MADDFQAFSERFRQAFANALPQYLPPPSGPASRLYNAMHYSVLNGGKRVRPLLLVSACEALGGTIEQAMPAACAIECLHSYSLVHDDLPAMDDDDLRRGNPTCHIAFDEATAILAGDALQTLSFEILLSAPQYNDVQRVSLLRELGRAAGGSGMVAGQMIDLQATGKVLTEAELQFMHQLKTGALIEASVLMGARLGSRELIPTLDAALRRFARAIGLAFQIRDDILDVESDTPTLGKTSGKDAAFNKATYTSLLGLSGAREKLALVMAEARTGLEKAGLADTRLAQLAAFIAGRTH